MRDRRVKGCPNAECERNTKKYHYKATDNFCTICGEKLVFVCADCFKRIADEDPSHVICASCEAHREDMKKDAKKRFKDIGDKVGTVAGTVAEVAKDGAIVAAKAAKEGAEAATIAIKEGISGLKKEGKAAIEDDFVEDVFAESEEEA